MNINSSILYAINRSSFISEYIDVVEEDYCIQGMFYCFPENFDYAKYLVCDCKVYTLDENGNINEYIGKIEIY